MTEHKKIALSQPHFPERLRDAIAADIASILESGRLMNGPWSRKFEDRLAGLTGRTHAVSVNSCTTALQIALMFAGAADHDVLVPAGSFVTDLSAVEFAGGRPVLVDMNAHTLALDVDDLGRKVTPRTKALIWVHLTGIVAHNYSAILGFAKKHGLFVIEDASHAHGAVIDGRPAGSFGDVSCFSFYPTKILTSGTGGMLATDDDELARYAREMRLFGKEEGTGEIIHRGNDWFLDEIRACVGFHHASDLDVQLAHRRRIADRYSTALANQPGLRLLDYSDSCLPAWYQFPVFLSPGIDRAGLMERLADDHGIEAKGIYKPTHQEQIFRHLDDGTLKVTEDVLERSLCLPMHAGVSEADADRIAAAVTAEIRAVLS